MSLPTTCRSNLCKINVKNYFIRAPSSLWFDMTRSISPQLRIVFSRGLFFLLEDVFRTDFAGGTAASVFMCFWMLHRDERESTVAIVVTVFAVSFFQMGFINEKSVPISVNAHCAFGDYWDGKGIQEKYFTVSTQLRQAFFRLEPKLAHNLCFNLIHVN